jgi:hypothetical protein
MTEHTGLAGGDPWMRFRNTFRAQVHLAGRRKSGRLVRTANLGWLLSTTAGGSHIAHFRCRTLTGALYVHAHAVARDGAMQNSPFGRSSAADPLLPAF